VLCHFKYCFSHLPHLCCRLGVQETHVFATFNNVSVIYHSINVGRGWGMMCNASCNNFSVFYHTCAIGSGFRRLMVFATFNIVLVIYRTCAIGRGFRRLIFIATFKNVSVIYHSFAIGSRVQESHGFCHFQYCFSYLPHMCYRQGGSGCSCLLPLSIMFQSFTTRVLSSGHSKGSCDMPRSIFNHLPHLCCSQGGSRGLCFMPLSILFQSFTTPEL
jgi:hypothetical protein